MHELVHTSIPKGLFGGTGYAVAAATRDMPESLRLALQGISNLEDSTPGVTWSARVVNASGGPCLGLSRQQPDPADHTGRTHVRDRRDAIGDTRGETRHTQQTHTHHTHTPHKHTHTRTHARAHDTHTHTHKA